MPETKGDIAAQADSSEKMKETVGLIAGNGSFPVLFLEKARGKGYRTAVAAYRDEASADIEPLADVLTWVHLGQVKKLIAFFQSHGVRRVVMLGGIAKTRMFTNVRPDLLAIRLIAGLKHTHDDAVLRAFARGLEERGLVVTSASDIVPELLAAEGVWTRRHPTKTEFRDLELGWETLAAMGHLDIGQSLVVCGGTVVAVEAVEGTDAAILRGGQLAKKHAVLVKRPKPTQDLRFDMPAVGPATIETMHRAGVTAMMIAAGETVALHPDRMAEQADRYGIAIVSRVSTFEKAEDRT